MLYTIGLIIAACIFFALDEAHGIFSKILFASVVCILGASLIALITDSDSIWKIVEFCSVVAVLMVIIPVLIAIFKKSD